MASDVRRGPIFSFSGLEWDSDLITGAVLSAFSEVVDQMPPIDVDPIEDVTAFAQSLHDSGLPVCDADDLEDQNHGAPIGSGATMTVFKCFWKSRNRAVAVKRLNLGVPLGLSQADANAREYSGLLQSLLRELRVMNHPWCKAHPNFVNLLGVTWDVVAPDEGVSRYRPAVIVELADPVTPRLSDLVTTLNYPLDIGGQQLMFDLLTDVAEAVTMLHAMKIVHGDLKPDNILLFPAPNRILAKLSDFGFCSPFADRQYRIGGTLYWNAPVCSPSFALSQPGKRGRH